MRLCNLLPPALVLAALLFPVPGHAAGDPEKGRAIAVEHCSRCHVVGEHNPMGGIGSTPSFQLLRSMTDWRDRPNAAPFTITIADVDHIVAFAEALDPLW
jgi:mono/diheme cytochrome c family protein